jgi:hypothetical protein
MVELAKRKDRPTGPPKKERSPANRKEATDQNAPRRTQLGRAVTLVRPTDPVSAAGSRLTDAACGPFDRTRPSANSRADALERQGDRCGTPPVANVS